MCNSIDDDEETHFYALRIFVHKICNHVICQCWTHNCPGFLKIGECHILFLSYCCQKIDSEGAMINDIRAIWSSYKMIAYIMIFVHNDRLRTVQIDEPSKLIYSSVLFHLDYICFNGRLYRLALELYDHSKNVC